MKFQLKKNKKTVSAQPLEPNHIGVAFECAGLIPTSKHIDYTVAELYLKNAQELKVPKTGAAVVVRDNYVNNIQFVGVIGVDSMVNHYKEFKGTQEEIHINQLRSTYEPMDYNISYYIPGPSN